MGMKMQPKSQRNIESNPPSGVTAFLDQYIQELGLSRHPSKLLSALWLLQQPFAAKSLREETPKEVDEQTIENLTVEIRELRDELKRHSDLLKISNDLLLELNANLKIQESQSYFWTDAWLEGERQADEDIKNHNVHTFETADQIIEFLRGSL
jgi:hypothetical protein